ncbi:hypothetical protein A2160_05405 [Candidatus Beckwithbacteria bacterium RBG_13_42_9]|uniref:IMP dehydrogenase/GMP reductase domain-containing protein n=1 Tax=Candidatus Beckwithbacteria bacterium RBG_13_42_9 TaxID=1797457 RepID=A0A1F5E6R7_9BACT|nr:MAG: hypothetical protein A2160_05405 [Candidatus Beckwithbacteria bacterium RBG_13_42_9]
MTQRLIPSFQQLLKNTSGERYIQKRLHLFQKEKMLLFKRWYKETGEDGEVYPSQGLLITPFDYLPYVGKTLLPEEELWQTLKMRWYVLEIFNHPQRLNYLIKTEKEGYRAPPQITSQLMIALAKEGLAISVRDLGLQVRGTKGRRISRRKILLTGPFIRLGKYARIPFFGGAMPDIFGAPAALATMAESHGLACVPRNGVFSDPKRQVALAEAAMEWMKQEPLLMDRPDKEILLKRWQHNLVGVIEPSLVEGLNRAQKLYQVGVRTFRVYSPEPGREVERTVKILRQEWGEKIEIFAGQVASLDQAKKIEKAGADGLYVGIGGGGRCTTAVRSSSVIDWPELVWKMRGEVHIPVIVEGGASDHTGITLALGASGIGVSRIAGGGTIESPGGALYLVNKEGEWFKPYGGEASARTKYQDKKMLACNMPAFVEGKTTKAMKSYIPHILPTMAQNLFFLIEDLVLSLVFRGISSVNQLQALDPSPLRRITPAGVFQQNTH